ncbi:MAG TPA: OmpA family protein [Polyangiaceae bacterium]|jgi:outer membrane protein OmpA-like peptidoglycan-associated protein
MKRSYLGRNAAKWLGCGVLAISAAACASDKTPAKEPQAMGEMTAPGPQSPRREGDTTIAFSDDFRRECQLPNTPKDSPHFEYADATLHAHGANILDDVAKCLSEGPLKGRVITIIGRTDARGSAAYNKELSANRAEAARNYLVQRGVAAANVHIIARGEQGAQGTNEESWARDRRVDFELGDKYAKGNAAANNLNASPDPVIEGTRMQALSPNNNVSKANGSAYSDTAEGGHEAGSGKGSGSATGSASGSASGSVNVGAGSK